mmetsp:Transcript_14976/g.18983  ORF Transcript_14976/g.18983 Transcript_14976/m.18983 type:complete len:158 (-) Transcript_14976:235-708(-)
MKTSMTILAALAISANAFAPSSTHIANKSFTSPSTSTSTSLSMAKYNTMDEILAKFPDDKPILINFYDAATEADIKSDIVRAKNLLAERCTVVSIKQQDYPEIAKLWDADTKSPSMILFKDGNPVTRLYEETFYLDIVAKIGKYCRAPGEEHKEIKK